jgi:hypothetical protein
MTANIDDGAKEKAEQGVDALSHVALVTGDTAWAADFAKIAAPFGARISRLTEPEQIPASVIGEYSSVVFAGDRFDGASLEALHAGRTPFLVVAEPQIDAVRKNLENIRPLNLVRPSTNSAAEALHRLISYGAMR